MMKNMNMIRKHLNKQKNYNLIIRLILMICKILFKKFNLNKILKLLSNLFKKLKIPNKFNRNYTNKQQKISFYLKK